MNWLVYHIASGHAFFTGVGFIIIAAAASTQSKGIATRIAFLAFSLGVIAVTISSAAIPYWYYAFAVLSTLVWVASWRFKQWRRWSPFVVIGVWAVAAGLEIPFHFTLTPAAGSSRSITVIGDSVTAGAGGGDESVTWPNLLAKKHNLTVQDISHVGETAASALKRVNSQPITSSIILLEIGGNDLLGSTSSAQFAQDLDALLAYVGAANRQVIMFELPLPPFCHEYGRIQRSLARKHNVQLIPKRVFLSVLAADDATLDTIHLTQAGHQRMADCVWRLIRPAFSEP